MEVWDFTCPLHKYLLREVLGRCSNASDYVYIFMHDFVVFSTCCDGMHDMSLYESGLIVYA